MKNTKNIVLIGMSGAGKSTLGVLLAKALGKHFTDTDLLIQQHTGMLLQQILDTYGIDRFLETEEQTVSSLDCSNCVIATGGSVVYSEKAMRALKQNSVTVYLYVDYEELAGRLSNITTRGIVFKGKNDLHAVYSERLPLYEKYADITVHCSGKSIEESVEEVIKALFVTENGKG